MKVYSCNKICQCVLNLLKNLIIGIILLVIAYGVYKAYQAAFAVHLSYHNVVSPDHHKLALKYVFTEFEPRAAMGCPAGFAITEIKYKFFQPHKSANHASNAAPLGYTQTDTEDKYLVDYTKIWLNNETLFDMIRHTKFKLENEMGTLQYKQQLEHIRFNQSDDNDFYQLRDGDNAEQEDIKPLEQKIINKSWAGSSSRHGPCPTLVHCLGHQACLFHYSNKFCQNDPIPGSRKELDVRIYCSRDESYLTAIDQHIQQTQIDQISVNNVEQFYDYIGNIKTYPQHTVFLRYESELRGATTTLRPPTTYMIPEEEVYNVTCPAPKDIHATGYRGICYPIERSIELVSDDLWTRLAREPCSSCRKELLEVYCAFMFNPKAECLPPYMLNQSNVMDSASGVGWSHNAMPSNGNRYKLSQYYHILEHPQMSLIPVRLAFFIMGYEGAQAIMQLLKQVYHPTHYYVIITNVQSNTTRDELKKLLFIDFHNSSNIRVIPHERSFASSWGSYVIQRAQLECYEELLRMGVWDFAIYLSGRDLAIRSVEDLAVMLAPYRGSNMVKNTGQLPPMYPPLLVAWHGCNRHVYNVTTRMSPQLGLWRHSNFAIYSRDYLEFVLSNQRGHALDRIQFYLQTSPIPDEMFLGTMLYNSNFRHTAIDVGMHFQLPFVGDNADNLCRHSEETDGCGRGPPDFTRDDLPVLLEYRHNFFFSRKYETNAADEIRHEVLNLTSNASYYDEITKYTPPALQRKLAEKALRLLIKRTGRISEEDFQNLSISRMQVVPKLLPSDPCCLYKLPKPNNVLIEFRLILHFSVLLKNGTSTTASADFVLNPHSTHVCYPGGHIQAIYITTRNESLNEGQWKVNKPMPPNLPAHMRDAWTEQHRKHIEQAQKMDQQGSPLLTPLPSVVLPSGGGVLWLHFVLNLNIIEQCASREKKTNIHGDNFIQFKLPSFVPPPAKERPSAEEMSRYSVPVVIQVYDREHHAVYDRVHALQRGHLAEKNPHKPEKIETDGTTIKLELENHTFTEGTYTVTVRKKGDNNGFLYRQSVIVIDASNTESFLKDEVVEQFKVTSAAWQDELESDQFYVNIPQTNMENHNAVIDVPFYNRLALPEGHLLPRKHRKIESRAEYYTEGEGRGLPPRVEFFVMAEAVFIALNIAYGLFLYSHRKSAKEEDKVESKTRPVCEQVSKPVSTAVPRKVPNKRLCCYLLLFTVVYHVTLFIFYAIVWQRRIVHRVHDEH